MGPYKNENYLIIFLSQCWFTFGKKYTIQIIFAQIILL